MTLSTHLWVADPVKIDELWGIGRALIHAFSSKDGQAAWEDKEVRPGVRERSHLWGQGYCAIYEIEYREDGSLLHDGNWEHDPDWCFDPERESPCAGAEDHERECFPYYADIFLDTSYGYIGPGGDSAGELHSRILGAIGAWLDDQGVGWKWLNEFTGEVFTGAAELATLGSGGKNARDWFERIMPLVLADVQEGS